jgi:hypothetical protein
MKGPSLAVLALAIGNAFAGVVPGYTLVPGSNSTNLLDSAAKSVKSWAVGGYTAYLLDNGHLLGQSGMGAAPAAGYGSLVQMNGTTQVNSWSVAGMHHAHWVMPNGHWLAIVAVKINPKTALASVGYTGTLTSIWDERIQEYDPVSKTVVWEWKASDHMSGTNTPRKINPNLFKSSDPIHVNSVAYDPTRDVVVMSSHYLNEIFVVDHSTTTSQAATATGGNFGKGGDILFRWGAPKNYGGTTATYSNVIHGGTVVQPGFPGAGNFMFFGNYDNAVKHSRVYEVEGVPSDTGWVVGSNGEFSSELLWDWYSTTGTYESNSHFGYGQRLGNGNTLITFSQSKILAEVDSKGALLKSTTLSVETKRAIRYPMDHAALAALGLGSTTGVSRSGAKADFSLRLVGERLSISGLSANTSIRVLDTQGRVVHQGTALNGSASVPTNAWSRGNYVVEAVSSGSRSTGLVAIAR